jgi:uncharacterized protein YdeI (YjbR/CyaY-like superfamily)
MPRKTADTLEAAANCIHPTTLLQWRRWLSKNHGRQEGIWLISFKKETGRPRMQYAEAVEEAICFGWVDSLPRKLDAERSMLWFAPRKPGSAWSKINKGRVVRLTAQGRMQPAGQAKVDAAKKDGSWRALDNVEKLVIPRDLEAALGAHGRAAFCFEHFPRSVKRGILEWIQKAKKTETRAKRIEETARLASKNIRANQWRQ